MRHEPAQRIQQTVDHYCQLFSSLRPKAQQRAKWFSYDAASDLVLLQNLLGWSLFAQLVSITTPANRVLSKEGDREVDMVDRLIQTFQGLAGGLWAKLVADDLCQRRRQGVWLFVYSVNNPDGLLQMLDLISQTVNSIPGANEAEIVEAFCSEEVRIRAVQQCYEVCNEALNKGLYNTVGIICLVAQHLKLNPVCIRFIVASLKDTVWAFAKIDGSISNNDRRFAESMIGKVEDIVGTYIRSGSEFSAQKSEDLFEVLKELDLLVGLDDVKKRVKEAANFVRVQQMRKQQGLNPIQISLHTVYSGNPGTGKTTVARLTDRSLG